MFYFCRTNMPVAKSTLADTFSWSAAEIGMIFTALTLMYALGQFINGQLGDRFGTRLIVTIGCAGSVLMNLAVFGVLAAAPPNNMSPSAILKLLVFFWGINGFFQAMGWSPIVKAMLEQLAPRERRILELRFGLDGHQGPPRTFKEIGRIVGLTRERVRQLEKKALASLKDLAEQVA